MSHQLRRTLLENISFHKVREVCAITAAVLELDVKVIGAVCFTPLPLLVSYWATGLTLTFCCVKAAKR